MDGRTLKVFKDPDPCSPALFLSTLEDGQLPVIDISFVGTIGEGLVLVDFAAIHATNVQVVGFNLASDAGSDSAPREIVTFALFGQLQLTVFKFDERTGQPAGSTTRCWSFAQSKAC